MPIKVKFLALARCTTLAVSQCDHISGMAVMDMIIRASKAVIVLRHYMFANITSW